MKSRELPSPENLLPCDGECFYFPGVFNAEECEQFIQTLSQDIPWRQEPIRLFGKWILQPRLTALIGNSGITYRYSGIEMATSPWPKSVAEIRSRIETLTQSSFAFALANFYRNGDDSMGWHSDDERELGPQPSIASVSFGAKRKFAFRHRKFPSKKFSIELESGSVLFMSGKTQDCWQHALPKSARVRDPRLNLTFRPWTGFSARQNEK